MPPPEMSYSPAHHQAQDPISSARSILAPLPPQSLEYPEPSYSNHRRLSSAELVSYDVSPRISGPRNSHAHSRGASQQASRVSEEATTAAARVSMIGGAAQKESSSRGSWVDHPPSMSAEHASTIRTSKRGSVTVISANYDQDAPLMLVSDVDFSET